MDIRRIKENIVPILTNSNGDSPFQVLRILTHGLSGVRTAKLINFMTQCLDKGEAYVEIGTFSGYTLISSGYQNNSVCIGIDDFSMADIVKAEHVDSSKGMVEAILKKNLSEYGTVNMRFINSDFRNIEFGEDFNKKLGVLFIDGYHDYKNVKETLEKFEPFMMDNAVVIFDDVNTRDIAKYVHEICAKEDYEMLAYLASTNHQHDQDFHLNMPTNEYIANGIAVVCKKEKVIA